MGGNSSNHEPPPLQLPRQQVVSTPHARVPYSASLEPRGLQTRAAAVPSTQRVHTEQAKVKVPFVWDKNSLVVQRVGAEKHRWRLSVDFSAEVPCVLQAHFHSRFQKDGSGAAYVQAAEGGPPAFQRSFAAGRHAAILEDEHSIDLRSWPLEVFWKYKQKQPDVFPIIFVLSVGTVQSAVHIALKAPGNGGGNWPLQFRPQDPLQLECLLLKQKLVIDSQEYVVEEIYGLAELGKDDAHDESAVGQPCVICLTDPRNSAITPCRHLCVCRDCAAQLQVAGSRQCPICRGPIQGIKVFDVD